jgi:ABC-type transport system involved in multi-copper enzyme maturation permease subunit
MSVEHAELTKVRSVPSTGWSLLAAVAATVGFGILYAMIRVSRPPAGPGSFDATGASLAGVQLAQIAVGVLGALVITGEYRTGSIRATFAAVPRRMRVLVAKAVVVAAVTFAVSLPAAFAAFVAGQRILAPQHLDVGLGEPGVLRAIAGSALYLSLVALLGLGLGVLLRNTAGAIGALFGLLFGAQIMAGLLPASIADHISRYLPAPAGLAVTFDGRDPSSLPPWIGFAVFALYTAVVLALGAWRLRRADA